MRIAMPHNLPIHICRDVADTDTGDFTGRVIKELSEGEDTKAIWKCIVEKPSEGQLPGGESLLGMQQRVVMALDHIAKTHPDPKQPDDEDGKDAKKEPQPPSVIAVVMHADPIKAAIAHYLGVPFDHFQRIGVSPASVSTVMLDGEGKALQIININHVPYETGK
jgi:probable phosphoglycerate mutase